MFANKVIEVWSKGKKTQNNFGQWVYGKPVKLATGKADIQPYSRAEAKEDYGFTIDCTKRMFCDLLPIEVNEVYIKHGSKFYEVTELIEWANEPFPFNDFMEVFLNECTVYPKL